MQPSILELMSDQVRAIYRAATGMELVEPPPGGGEPTVDLEEVTARFADLEVLSRHLPQVAQRVPPFSFEPPVDVIETAEELLVEVGVPGVLPEDVCVARRDGMLVVGGLRRGERAATGRTHLLAEMPRGTFERAIALPPEFESEPEVRIENGTITVHLPRRKRPLDRPAAAVSDSPS